MIRRDSTLKNAKKTVQFFRTISVIMVRHSCFLSSTALFLILFLFTGCQDSNLTDMNNSSSEITLNQNDLFNLIDDAITSKNDAIWLTTLKFDDISELDPNKIGTIDGGVRFGQFAGDNAYPLAFAIGLNKAEPDPGFRAKVKFARCVLDDVLSCSDGGTVHQDEESGDIHYHSNC